MPYHWQRPTAEQAARGIVAVYVLTYRVWHAKKRQYMDIQMPCPYRTINIQRRINRGGNLPYWIEVVKPLDSTLAIFDLPENEFTRALENIA